MTLRRVMIVLAVVGIGVAGYLTYVHYAGIKPACTAGQSCIKVQTSVWSKVDGVPVALIGLIGYIAILASLLAPDRDETRMATLGLTLVGFAFSAYLTYREGHSIHAYCEWCLSSAVIMTVLFGCSIWRFVTGGGAEDGAPATTGSPEQPALETAPVARKTAARR
jgi:uncharacterized membrane protein